MFFLNPYSWTLIKPAIIFDSNTSCQKWVFSGFVKGGSEFWIFFIQIWVGREDLYFFAIKSLWYLYVFLLIPLENLFLFVAALMTVRSTRTEVFLRKGIRKICSKFTGELPCQSAISIKLQSNFIEIKLMHECAPVNLLHILRTPFLKNTPELLLLDRVSISVSSLSKSTA